MIKKALVLSLSLGLVGNVSANNVDALVALAQAEGMEAVEQVIAQAALEDQSEVNVIKKHKKLLLTVAGTAAATAAVVVLGQMAYNAYKTPAQVKLANKVIKAAKNAKDKEAFDKEVEKILKDVKAEDKAQVVTMLDLADDVAHYTQQEAVLAFGDKFIAQAMNDAAIVKAGEDKVKAAEKKAKDDAEKAKEQN
ncbi:hypothetical protein IPF37_01085 [bacterium]|nr:MAG: hypothetical protein IPF37_01085 [bacterium]